MTKYKIIHNPTADKGVSVKMIPQIDQLLRKHDLDFGIVHTEYPWHAAELAWQAVEEGYDIVVAAGGDGTANEVINGLMLAKESGTGEAIMGVIPIGRGNDFAFGMDIPLDIEASIEALAKAEHRAVDIGCISGGFYPEGRYFGNGVGIGFDAVVGFLANENPYLHGFMSYLWAAIKTVFLYFNAPKVEIALDNEKITRYALMVSIMNGQRLGGAFYMAPQSITTDGLLDICIVDQVSRPRIFVLISKFMQGSQYGEKDVLKKHSSKIVVTALEGTLPAHADGETMDTDANQITAELLPGQIELICKPVDKE